MTLFPRMSFAVTIIALRRQFTMIRAGKKYTQGKTEINLNRCVDGSLLAK